MNRIWGRVISAGPDWAILAAADNQRYFLPIDRRNYVPEVWDVFSFLTIPTTKPGGLPLAVNANLIAVDTRWKYQQNPKQVAEEVNVHVD